jgi:hypothetical protein
MEIGKPRRIHRVEPLKDPVPERPQEPEPKEAPRAPAEVPSK